MADEMTLADGKRGHLAQCKGPRCPEFVVWVYNERTGKTSPYNVQPSPEGKAVSHFATCIDADRFRRPKGAPWV